MQQLPVGHVPFEDIETEATDLSRFRTDLDDLADLKASIQRFGLLVPPVVWRTEVDGAVRWVVMDGARRVKALQELKFAAEYGGQGFPFRMIYAAIFDGTLDEARMRSALIHVSSVEHTSLDLAFACTQLLQRGMSQTEVARLSGRTQGWASQCAAIATGLHSSSLERARAYGKFTWVELLEVAALTTAEGDPDAASQAVRLDELAAEHAQLRTPPLRGRAAAKARREGRT